MGKNEHDERGDPPPGTRDGHPSFPDTAFDSRELMRLPDGQLVPATEYERALRDYDDADDS